jgi:hypothetical protein
MELITIKGQRIIDIYESFDGSYWFVTETAWKQDSVIGGKLYKNDQILFGYVRLSSCPGCAEFGYFSEAELKSLDWRVWKVHRQDWAVCPGVEFEHVRDEQDEGEAAGCGGSDRRRSCSNADKGGDNDEAAGI